MISHPVLLGILYVLVAGSAVGHVLLFKRDPKAAWAWITVCTLFPLGGSLLYFWFGVNRVERRARRELRAVGARPALPDVQGVSREGMTELARTGASVSGNALVAGNCVEALHNGEQAYPAMLGAIAGADRRVWMSSYIFDGGETASRFVAELSRALARGVEVRVLLDGVGALGSSGCRRLEEAGIPTCLFLPLRLFPPMLHVNLRNHRKLLLVDGQTAFVGGMNIADNHLLSYRDFPRADMQFRIRGPVITQLSEVFAEDWLFASGEALEVPKAPKAPSAPAEAGTSWCRAVTDGPNADTGRLQLLLLAAIASAHRRICVMTPYFIPTPELVAALKSAALRGVAIDMVLPERSDQRWVDWASRRWLRQLVGPSLRIFFQPAPFPHTKLFVVDSYYVQVGSANMDSRSLRLNFELNLEIYDESFARGLEAHCDAAKAASRELTLAAVEAQPTLSRLRDAVAWLFSPAL